MRSWGAEVSRPIRIGALNIGGQRCWTIRADVRTLAASNWKSGPDTVWLSIIGIYSGVCCVIGQHSCLCLCCCARACAAVLVLVLLCLSLCCSFYAIPHRAWERLGDNCREKSNKHFFTDKRVGDRKALPKILNQFDRKVSPWLKKKTEKETKMLQ